MAAQDAPRRPRQRRSLAALQDRVPGSRRPSTRMSRPAPKPIASTGKGTDQNLLDGSIAGAHHAQVRTRGHTATSPREPDRLPDPGRQRRVGVRRTPVPTRATRQSQRNSANTAIQTGGLSDPLGAVRDQLAADANRDRHPVGQVTTCAVTLDRHRARHRAALSVTTQEPHRARSRPSSSSSRRGAGKESTCGPLGDDRSSEPHGQGHHLDAATSPAGHTAGPVPTTSADERATSLRDRRGTPSRRRAATLRRPSCRQLSAPPCRHPTANAQPDRQA